MLEELEASGEIELALKDWQLAMLTSGGTAILPLRHNGGLTSAQSLRRHWTKLGKPERSGSRWTPQIKSYASRPTSTQLNTQRTM
jgi:hypothetical protein